MPACRACAGALDGRAARSRAVARRIGRPPLRLGLLPLRDERVGAPDHRLRLGVPALREVGIGEIVRRLVPNPAFRRLRARLREVQLRQPRVHPPREVPVAASAVPPRAALGVTLQLRRCGGAAVDVRQRLPAVAPAAGRDGRRVGLAAEDARESARVHADGACGGQRLVRHRGGCGVGAVAGVVGPLRGGLRCVVPLACWLRFFGRRPPPVTSPVCQMGRGVRVLASAAIGRLRFLRRLRAPEKEPYWRPNCASEARTLERRLVPARERLLLQALPFGGRSTVPERRRVGAEPEARELLQEPRDHRDRFGRRPGRAGATVVAMPNGLGQPGSRRLSTGAVEQQPHVTAGKLRKVDRLGRLLVVEQVPRAVCGEDGNDVVAAARSTRD